jgi:hypothetical protein
MVFLKMGENMKEKKFTDSHNDDSEGKYPQGMCRKGSAYITMKQIADRMPQAASGTILQTNEFKKAK